MFRVVKDFVFKFIREMHNGEDNAFSRFMGDAKLDIPSGKILEKVIRGLDDDELEEIWWKEEYGELTQEEQEILRQYNAWYEENALQRLPYLRRSPVWVMNRAWRFVRLVSLRAPEIVIANEERFLAEEMALYCGVVDFG
jgi:hypothetical protein